MEESQEQLENSSTEHLKPWQFKPGQSGNPGGRPKGSISVKEYAKRMLLEMTDEEKLDFMKGLDKDKIWEMAEGKPSQGIGQASDLEKLQVNIISFDDSNNPSQPKTE